MYKTFEMIGERMENIRRIIIPVDDTEDSKNAVKEGAFFAKLLGVDAKIITVNDTHQFMSSVILEEKLKQETSAFLDGFKKIAEEYGVNAETELIIGNPAEEIVKFVNETDLIIMAYHEKTKGIDKIMEKSVSREVVSNAPCAVLVVKNR
jgi:nucleotide-binding universal stress UspA family protein